MLGDIVVREAFIFLFVSFRLIPMLMVAPVLGDATIPARFRVTFGFLFSVAVAVPLASKVPELPPTALGLLGLFLYEFIIGLMIGLSARLLLSAAHVAGTIAAFQTGLAAAQNFDPNQGGQTAILSSFMTVTAVTLLVVNDAHHLMLFGIINSYDMFPSGEALPVSDFTAVVMFFVSRSFQLGVQLAAPFLVYAILFNVGLGLMARLAPRIQIFFVAMPLSVYLGFALFAVLLPSIMLAFMDHFRELFVQFLP